MADNTKDSDFNAFRSAGGNSGAAQGQAASAGSSAAASDGAATRFGGRGGATTPPPAQAAAALHQHPGAHAVLYGTMPYGFYGNAMNAYDQNAYTTQASNLYGASGLQDYGSYIYAPAQTQLSQSAAARSAGADNGSASASHSQSAGVGSDQQHQAAQYPYFTSYGGAAGQQQTPLADPLMLSALYGGAFVPQQQYVMGDASQTDANGSGSSSAALPAVVTPYGQLSLDAYAQQAGAQNTTQSQAQAMLLQAQVQALANAQQQQRLMQQQFLQQQQLAQQNHQSNPQAASRPTSETATAAATAATSASHMAGSVEANSASAPAANAKRATQGSKGSNRSAPAAAPAPAPKQPRKPFSYADAIANPALKVAKAAPAPVRVARTVGRPSNAEVKTNTADKERNGNKTAQKNTGRTDRERRKPDNDRPRGDGNSTQTQRAASLPGTNPSDFAIPPKARYFVIKSYNPDDVHKAIKYNVWASTPDGNKRLKAAWEECSKKNIPIYLFYSVNGSRCFCGMAEMTSDVDYDKSFGGWSIGAKWMGQFTVKWIFIKNIPNKELRHIRMPNNQNKAFTNSRDTQEVLEAQAHEALKVFRSYNHRASLLDEFEHFDKEEEKMKSVAADSAAAAAAATAAADGSAKDGKKAAKQPEAASAAAKTSGVPAKRKSGAGK